MRIIVSLQCSQLPIGNWLFDFIKLTENLWAEPQADRIVKPFHAVLIIPYPYNTYIIGNYEFCKFINSQSYHVPLKVRITWVM